MITENFSIFWPEVFGDVVRTLRRRGFDLHTAEDAAQEAGARAFDRQIPFESAAELRRWCRVAAHRIAIDTIRHDSHVDHHPLAEAHAHDDVAAAAENRIRLAAARRAWPKLSPWERRAIFDDSEPATRQEAVRLAVRRHRARTHLLRLVEGAAVLIGFLWRRGTRATTSVALAAAVPIVAWTALQLTSPTERSVDGGDGDGARVVIGASALALADAPVAGVTGGADGAARSESAGGPVTSRPPSVRPADAPHQVVAASTPTPGSRGGDTYLKVEEKTPGRRTCVEQQLLGVEQCAPDVDWPLPFP